MNPNVSTPKTRIKVGVFTLVGLLAIGLTTVLVNDHPYWWRPCQLVHINVEDATGLKSKSPIRSLGLEIGYLESVELAETYVSLGICITAPVEVLPSTRAYIRSEGFLGDKFVELKPMRYTGGSSSSSSKSSSSRLLNLIIPEVHADETIPVASASPAATSAAPAPVPAPTAPATSRKTRSSSPNAGGREIPVGEANQDVQHLVGRVDSLVAEMTSLTSNLKQSINPEELRATMRQLNKTLENASKTLAPEGGLNQTAQRTLSKLEDAVEQLRDQMTRINQGKGSLGMLLNDPSYAEEIRQVIRNANQLLSKVSSVRFVVDIGGQEISGYNGGRGYFKLQIFPNPTRYYLVGISVDPRGRRTSETVTTTEGGSVNVVQVERVETTGILLTGMVGKIFFNRLDLSLGALYGDGAVRASVYLGPKGTEERFQIQNDIYSHNSEQGVDYRVAGLFKPWGNVYVTGGLESVHKINGTTPLFYGAGVAFDDEDIKILFALR